ncbi:MAG TPA: outer membrane protein assembly factor BamE [Ideonella sp.]|nr:outer membrane protein assembly factor BamE [Ideonella sp.]
MRRFVWATLLAATLLPGCDQQRIEKLEEGVATEADVRRQFGEPATVVEHADGSKLLEYPRQPEGTTNYAITIGSDGKMSSLRQLLHPANFSRVQPGMAQDEVRRLLGKPAKVWNFPTKPDESTWDWRFQDGQQRKIFSVVFDGEHRVQSSHSTDDTQEAQRG